MISMAIVFEVITHSLGIIRVQSTVEFWNLIFLCVSQRKVILKANELKENNVPWSHQFGNTSCSIYLSELHRRKSKELGNHEVKICI